MAKKITLSDQYKVRLLIDSIGIYYPLGETNLCILHKYRDHTSTLHYKTTEDRDKDLTNIDIAVAQ